jgi:DNA-directed RNA polymerase specialized sigma24 family protein
MVLQAGDREQARAAWEELYVRHHRYLYAVAFRAYGSFLGSDGVADLVVDAFRRAYEWAGRQSSPEQVRGRFTGDNPDSTRRRVLGWLGTISERLFKDRFRDHASRLAKQDELVEDLRLHEESDLSPDPLSVARLQEAIATLSQNEVDALRVSLPWYDLASRSFATPRGEASRLAGLLGISPETLRQRRHQAIRKLGQRLQDMDFTASTKERSR